MSHSIKTLKSSRSWPAATFQIDIAYGRLHSTTSSREEDAELSVPPAKFIADQLCDFSGWGSYSSNRINGKLTIFLLQLWDTDFSGKFSWRFNYVRRSARNTKWPLSLNRLIDCRFTGKMKHFSNKNCNGSTLRFHNFIVIMNKQDIKQIH